MTNEEVICSLRNLARGGQPQNDISEFLYRHKFFYLLSLLNNNTYSKPVTTERILNRISVRERYAALKPFFENASFPYAVIKGAVLSQAAYKDAFIRSSGDIDLLIARRDSDKMKEWLISAGFIQGRVTDNGIVPFTRREILFQTTMSHQTAPYVKATDNELCPYINVDINTDILWGESGGRADMDLVLSHVIPTEICGITVNKLSSEMEFISLCLHHYKDMNSIYLLYEGGFKLNHFSDIYFYLLNNELDRQKLVSISKELNVGSYIYYCIYHTNLIFVFPALNEYLTLFEHVKDPKIMDSLGLCDSERKTWHIDFYQRLFHPDLKEYLDEYLTENDKRKIHENKLNM